MEEILHHLIGSLSVHPIIYRILYVHPRWLFVISSINFDPFTVYPPEKEPTRPENSRFLRSELVFQLGAPLSWRNQKHN